jgi:hypothetical protein
MAYWIGAWVLGPRYYFEGLYSLTIASAAGIAVLAGWPLKAGQQIQRKYGKARYRPLLVTTFVALLVMGNFVFYLPMRIGGMQGLFGTSREQLDPFQAPEVKALAPALVIVDADYWRDYAGLLELANPFLDSPFIFIWDRGANPNLRVIQAFPDRTAYLYRPQDPLVFYKLVPP